MADEPEVIRHQMEETRTDISDKLETLEEEFAQGVQNASDSVSETVAEVKGTVQDTVETVQQTVHETLDAVKSAFDIPHQVDRHPWLMVGGAVAVGYLGGCVLSSLEEPRGEFPSRWEGYGPDYQATVSGYEGDGPKASSTSQWVGELAEKFRPELDQLKGLAIGAALSIARDLLTRSLPEEARQKVGETVDSFTVKLGGKPIQGLVPEKEPEPSTAG